MYSYTEIKTKLSSSSTPSPPAEAINHLNSFLGWTHDLRFLPLQAIIHFYFASKKKKTTKQQPTTVGIMILCVLHHKQEWE